MGGEMSWIETLELSGNNGTLSAMLQSIGDHISIMDANLNIVWANDVAKKRFGDDIIGKKCHEAYHGSLTPCDPSPCITKRAFEDGRIHEHDTEVTDKDGNTICFHCTINVVLGDANGNPTRIIEISRDITEFKKALYEKEKLIKQLQEALHKIDTLSGLLTVCSSCKKIRNDEGNWERIDEYIRNHTNAQFSHGICPSCCEKLYPELYHHHHHCDDENGVRQ